MLDNIVPTRGYQMHPMVGLGGSAGSISALQSFFAALPESTGMVFVVILHLSPEHESILAQLLSRSTRMPVAQAKDGMRVKPDHVYVIPPGKHLVSADGQLRLKDLDAERGRRTAVDLFFRTLADTHGPHSTAVVLSGADGDGAMGIRRIKERGGLTIAQDPNEAEQSGMPRAAIATGMVDWVLTVGDMPGRIVDYYAHEGCLRLPPEDGPQPAKSPAQSRDLSETALRDVLIFLRTKTGCDFSYYKRATIVRRISRRMQVNGVHDMTDYLGFLRTHPGEAGALLQDLLISVTNFFRDREAFEALAKRIPGLFQGKGPSDTVRVWVPACATGEEAYSLAMLLLEHARTLDAPPSVQVFGCDLDEDSIRTARAGIYPEVIAADVSEERLRRFFVKETRGYRVRREVREMVLFASHDLLKDAPFSRMDLISCRNLLIYLNNKAQERAIEIFHFALRHGGILFLGTSESVPEGNHDFPVLDKKHRIYSHRGGSRMGVPVQTGVSTLARALEAQERGRDGPVVPWRLMPPGSVKQFTGVGNPGDNMSDLHFKLVERYAPPSLILNQDHDIVHLSENAGRFLHHHGGEPTMNLMRVVHPDLRIELRAALFRAVDSQEPVEIFRVPMELEGVRYAVDIRVVPVKEPAAGYLLVIFDARPAVSEGQSAVAAEQEPVMRHLERELEQLKSNLRETVEQYEASTEELKASNEELQAMNEELRSATEELETSREELQSINEELSTVNQELKGKVDELGHANSDLHNLMASTAIATVFLDRALHIMRYTPVAVGLFHLIPTDVGRPLSDLKHRLDYPQLTADAGQVLANLTAVEREVGDSEGKWYLVRVLPYRTTEDFIAGVVLTFVNITERKRAEQALAVSEAKFRTLADASPEMIWVLDANGQTRWANKSYLEFFGKPVLEQPEERWCRLVHPDDIQQVSEIMEAVEKRKALTIRARLRRSDGMWRMIECRAFPLNNEAGQYLGHVVQSADITDAAG